MNRKGFTLIETIMVIAILALLMLILVPNVILLINKNDTKSCQNLKDSIKNAAKIYVTDNKYTLGFNCPNNNSTRIELKTLVDSGYLKLTNGKLNNPKDDSEIELSKSVEVTYNCDTKEFTYKLNFTLNCE